MVVSLTGDAAQHLGLGDDARAHHGADVTRRLRLRGDAVRPKRVPAEKDDTNVARTRVQLHRQSTSARAMGIKPVMINKNTYHSGVASRARRIDHIFILMSGRYTSRFVSPEVGIYQHCFARCRSTFPQTQLQASCVETTLSPVRTTRGHMRPRSPEHLGVLGHLLRRREVFHLVQDFPAIDTQHTDEKRNTSGNQQL